MTTPSLAAALRFGAWLNIGLGLLIAAGTLPGGQQVLGWLTDLLFWPLDQAETAQDPAARLFIAISGGVIFGWGLTVLGLSGGVADAAPEALRRTVMRGYSGWFILDSAGSVWVGAWLNVLPNAAYLALLMWPLIRAR